MQGSRKGVGFGLKNQEVFLKSPNTCLLVFFIALELSLSLVAVGWSEEWGGCFLASTEGVCGSINRENLKSSRYLEKITSRK